MEGDLDKSKTEFTGQIKSLTEKNYRLYLQFDEYKKSEAKKAESDNKTLDEIALKRNTVITKLDLFDERYVKRIEIDSKHLKTAYRDQ